MEYIGIIVVAAVIFIFIGIVYAYRYFKSTKDMNEVNESDRLI
jgi:hypothetical protein